MAGRQHNNYTRTRAPQKVWQSCGARCIFVAQRLMAGSAMRSNTVYTAYTGAKAETAICCPYAAFRVDTRSQVNHHQLTAASFAQQQRFCGRKDFRISAAHSLRRSVVGIRAHQTTDRPRRRDRRGEQVHRTEAHIHVHNTHTSPPDSRHDRCT